MIMMMMIMIVTIQLLLHNMLITLVLLIVFVQCHKIKQLSLHGLIMAMFIFGMLLPTISFIYTKNLLAPPSEKSTPLYTFNHGTEGYAMGWSSVQPRLATGDCRGRIHIHTISADGATYTTSQALSANRPNNSIEDIVWSPAEASVFASVDTTGYLSVWHEGSKTAKLSVKAHDAEINVMSWNKHTNYLLATGADNGEIKIWDLRYIKKDPVSAVQACYQWHKKAITSINWHPHENSMFVASFCKIMQSLFWDFST
eukprot:UN00226